LYYERERPAGADAGTEPLPLEWLKRSAAAVASVTPAFNAQRMVRDYVTRYYLPASRRGERVSRDRAALAKELADWRERLAAAWSEVSFKEVTVDGDALESGETVEVDALLVAPGF